MIFHGGFFLCFSFYISDLSIFNTMNVLNNMAWYFVESLILRATIPRFIPLKKFAWRCLPVPAGARQKWEFIS